MKIWPIVLGVVTILALLVAVMDTRREIQTSQLEFQRILEEERAAREVESAERDAYKLQIVIFSDMQRVLRDIANMQARSIGATEPTVTAVAASVQQMEATAEVLGMLSQAVTLGNDSIAYAPLPTVTLTETPTATPVPTDTNTPTPIPTDTNTPTPIPTDTNTPTPIPTNTVTRTPIPTKTSTPTPPVFYKEDFSDTRPGYIPEGWIGGEQLQVREERGKSFLMNIEGLEKRTPHRITVRDVNFPENFKFEWTYQQSANACDHTLKLGDLDIFVGMCWYYLGGQTKYRFGSLEKIALHELRDQTAQFAVLKQDELLRLTVDGEEILQFRSSDFQSPSSFTFTFETDFRLYDITGVELLNGK